MTAEQIEELAGLSEHAVEIVDSAICLLKVLQNTEHGYMNDEARELLRVALEYLENGRESMSMVNDIADRR